MFQPHSWPETVLHLDGNSFFASIFQAVYPQLKGKPVIVGRERGIATAFSYEAKARGVKRGMLPRDIKRLCPNAIFMEGDYALFSLYSKKMFSILRRFSPLVEEYSIDEGFADIYGLRRPLNASYKEIGQRIQAAMLKELDIPTSVGISLTKSLAKLASGFKKPMGLTVVPGNEIEIFLSEVPIGDVWGIGPATSAYLKKLNIKTALNFASLSEEFVKEKLTKPYLEIWKELRGITVYKINPEAKNTYKSISKTHTFAPTQDRNYIWGELMENIEGAFKRARKYGYYVKKMGIFIKTQNFKYHTAEVILGEKQKYPLLFREKVSQQFLKIYRPDTDYRATGCVLLELSENPVEQGCLFDSIPFERKKKAGKVYKAIEETKVDFGSKLWVQKAKNKDKKEELPRFNLPLMEFAS